MRHITLLSLLLIATGAARIASTYSTFSATADEATHIGAGLELIEFHRYELQVANPPLPRLILASAPWLGGMRFIPGRSPDESLFYGRGSYVRDLILGRLGNLFFFLLAATALWLWARRELCETAALLATLFFTTQPIVLGYSGLATHDMAATAGVAVSLFFFSRWLETPTLKRVVAFGLAYGFSILCKFSCIAFVPAACAAVGLVRWISDAESQRKYRPILAGLFLVPLAAFLVVWAGCAFTVGEVSELAPWQDEFGTAISSLLERLDPKTPLPAPRFFAGVGELLRLDRVGHMTYFFGQSSDEGWIWYFPAAIALKTTLPFLILIVIGFFQTGVRRSRFLEATAAALAILATSLASTLDLGVRYVLPFFIPATFTAAAAAEALLRKPKAWIRAAVIALMIWHVGVSIRAHPDYFPYFNELAGSDPSRYLIDSNLDWGQDVLRLRRTLKEREISELGLSLFGRHDYNALGFPSWYHIHPWIPVRGWIAVSDHSYRMTRTTGGWQWLEGKNYQRVGKSIRLYYLP